jgi:hypothetical protein
LEAKEEWLKVLPPQTVAVLAVKDTQELLAEWDKGAISRFFEDPAVRKWMAPLFEGGEAPWDAFMKESTGETVSEALEAYEGASLIAFQWPPDGSGKTDPTFVELSEMASNKDKLLTQATQLLDKTAADGEGAKKGEEEIEGFTVHFAADGGEEDAEWLHAYVDAGDVLVEANDRTALTATLAALKSGAGGTENGPLLDNYQRFQEMAGEAADVTLYVDAELLLDKLTNLWKSDEGAAQGGAMANPMSPELVLGALNLKEIQGMGLTLKLDGGAMHLDAALLHAPNPKSLLVKMMRGADTRVDFPAFVPAEVPSASVTRWSLLGLYDGLMETLNGFGPMMAPMVQMQLGQMEQQLGIKLRDDLFATTDNQVIQLADFDPETSQPIQVTGIKLKDEARFVAALEAVKKMMGSGFAMFQEKEFAGVKVWELKPNLTPDAEGAGNQMAYCVAGGYLLVSNGAPNVLHKVLNRIEKAEGDSLWDGAEVKEALAGLPSDATGVGVSDGGVLVKGMMSMLATLQQTLASKAPPSDGEKGVKGSDAKAAMPGKWLDDRAVPEDAVFQRYFGITASGSYSLPDAALYRLHLGSQEAQ